MLTLMKAVSFSTPVMRRVATTTPIKVMTPKRKKRRKRNRVERKRFFFQKNLCTLFFLEF
ncbi:hypothetical protein OSTOST_15552, partial [Ostertagia ostertagi]